MEDPWEYYEENRRSSVSKRFSKIEIREIIIAVTIISLAFAIMLRDSVLVLSSDMLNYLAIFGLSALLVITSFIPHEMAHKWVAQKYGAWAEFRMYPAGLMMAIMFSFFGFLFAAPGAVYINGNINMEKNGKISIAGPLTNLVIGGIAMALCYITSGLWSDIFGLFAWLNVFLAFFNMLPINPMDGSKIFKWNRVVYVSTMAVTIAMLVATMLLRGIISL